MDEKFRKRVELLVDKVGGQSALARATNMSLGAIQRYLKGGDPTRLALMRLATAGEVSLSWLIFGEEGKMEVSSEGPQKFKMYGFGDSAKNGWQEPFQYRVRTELTWPDSECFAVVVSDNDLAQEGIKKGFTCYVSPNTRPQADDVVFVKNTDGVATFKKYLKEDPQDIHLEGGVIPQSKIDTLAPVVFVKRR